jgi:ubiquinone/menaquinone biosynthesis C-methylase UbiE
MKSPLSYRKAIPFFCHKSEAAFRADPYERYEDMVLRQVALHLADELWGGYLMQGILDFADASSYPDDPQHIVEIGCGVGKWIAELAQRYPESDCWGIDYSYQMLKQAHDYWVQGQDITLDVSNKGFDTIPVLKGHELKNLSFGLADAVDLPFDNDSQDLIVNSLLLDRLSDPIRGLQEMYRVLRPHGRLIMATPLNFQHADHWDRLYPAYKVREVLIDFGFTITAWQEDLLIHEPLDAHGNRITWKCVALAATKG